MSQTWKIVDLKAKASEILRLAQKHPQRIMNRGRAVAIIVSPESYESLEQASTAEQPRTTSNSWVQNWLRLASQARNDGGVDLELPAREHTEPPFRDEDL